MRTLGSPSESTVASAIASGSAGSDLRASSNQVANSRNGSSASVKSPDPWCSLGAVWDIAARSLVSGLYRAEDGRRKAEDGQQKADGDRWSPLLLPSAAPLLVIRCPSSVVCPPPPSAFRVANPSRYPHIGSQVAGVGTGGKTGVGRCATPMKCWGLRRPRMRQRSRAPIG